MNGKVKKRLRMQGKDKIMEKQVADWWRDAKFGMFIHWGIYAVAAGEWNGRKVRGNSEWIMERLDIPVKEYEEMASRFRPVQFNADSWVKTAYDAGMKYIVFTAKHHDGFAMFRSEDPFNIVSATPFCRDPLAELAESCRKYGLRLCLYYSHVLDWHEPDAFRDDIPLTKQDLVQEKNLRFRNYLEKKVKPQLKELLTGYGQIGALWFDMPGCIDPAYCREIREYVKSFQPECIISGRIGHGMGDYLTVGDNKIPLLPCPHPWEMPGTMNDTWGYKAGDRNWKTADELIRILLKIVSRGGNYLLNAGPDAAGCIPPESVQILKEIGHFLSENGEAVYGTSVMPPYPYDMTDGLFTARSGTLYYCCLVPHEKLFLSCIANPVYSVSLLSTKEPLPFTVTWSEASKCHDLVIDLPPNRPDSGIMVLKIEISGNEPVFEDIFQLPSAT